MQTKQIKIEITYYKVALTKFEKYGRNVLTAHFIPFLLWVTIPLFIKHPVLKLLCAWKSC